MLRRFCFVGLVGVVLLCAVVPTEAVTRVAKKLNFLEIGAGYASPLGKYDHISIIDFADEMGVVRDLEANRVFDPSFSVGISVGQLRNRWLVSLGAIYTKINQLDSFLVSPSFYHEFAVGEMRVIPKFDQFDFRLNVNYMLGDITASDLSPYAGLGAAAGIVSRRIAGTETDYDVNTLLSANFGVEFKLWSSADKRKFVTLASVNSYDLLSSGYRPRNLNIGGAIKVYARP